MKDISRLKASVTRAQKKLDKLIAENKSDQDVEAARESLKRKQNNLLEHATQARLPMFDTIPTKAQVEGDRSEYTIA